MNLQMTTTLGAVAIGRNEGERLRRCLESLCRSTTFIVYVDSGSTDGSQALAASLGVDVLALDTATPFTAARARNAGLARLMELHPDCNCVMFVDGDSEVVSGWLALAQAAFANEPALAVAAGRVRERFPRASIYNLLCDMEWNTPVGEGTACGGNAVMRCRALRAVGGFDETLIAGEEPELCVRLRAAGWKVRRLDAEMTLHDAAMTRFDQWWKRSVRAGHAYAEGAAMHGRGAQRHFTRESRSIWLWAVLAPLVALASAWSTNGFSLALLMVYPVLIARIALRRRRSHRDAWPHAWCYAAFCVLSKWPMLQGQAVYWKNRLLGKKSRIIEYKRPPSQAAAPTA